MTNLLIVFVVCCAMFAFVFWHKTKNIEQICINCRYRRFAGFKCLQDDSTIEMGRCHLNPPDTKGRFPLVKSFDQCSKFKKIKRKIRKRMETQYYKMPKELR